MQSRLASSASVREILKRFGGASSLAEISGVPHRRIRGWIENGSIPAKYWPELLRLSDKHDVPLVHDDLVAMAGARWPSEACCG